MQRNRVTVAEVARRAKVAPSTVSNVLNHPERVGPDTTDRVRKIIEELGYIRNRNARELRLAETRTVGLMLADASLAFYWQLEQRIEDIFNDQGFSVLVANSNQSPDREIRNRQTLVATGAAGLIVTPISFDVEEYLRLTAYGVCTVLVDYPFENEGLDIIAVDHYAGGRLGAEHLLSTGRRRIGVAVGPLADHPLILERYRGARDAIRAVDGAELIEIATNSLVEGGADIAEHFAASEASQRPDAFFGANDTLAISVVGALEDRGLRVPEDVAVVGYDDIAFPTAHGLRLTTIRQDTDGLGRAAADLLISKLYKRRTQAIRKVFTPTLTIRDTA